MDGMEHAMDEDSGDERIPDAEQHPEAVRTGNEHRRRNPVLLEERLILMEHAARRLKESGFVLEYVSMKSEACYYRFPGRDGVLRMAAHRYSGAMDKAVESPVTACMTFGPDTAMFSTVKMESLLASAIGRYFLGNGRSTARWRKASVRRASGEGCGACVPASDRSEETTDGMNHEAH